MKKFQIAAAIFSLTIFTYCKSKQTAVSPAPPAPTEGKQLAVAEAKWPGTKLDDLKQGEAIYTTKCTRCHKNFEITRFTEQKWQQDIDRMAPKAKLTPEEKLALTKHILSYREAYTEGKAE